jgi:hypothetical protein
VSRGFLACGIDAQTIPYLFCISSNTASRYSSFTPHAASESPDRPLAYYAPSFC